MQIYLLVVAATMVTAQADYHVKSGEKSPAKASSAQEWVVSTDDCRAYSRYRPGPGVEHKGHADVATYPDFNERARNLAIALKVRVDDQLPALGPTGNSVGGEGFLAFVEVRDGELYVDGKPLDPDAAAAVSEACRKALDGKKEKGQDR